MKVSTHLNRQFAHLVWNPLPALLQRNFSRAWSSFYKTKTSALLIQPFCHRYAIKAGDLARYQPASGAGRYESFQDFFTRKLARPLDPSHSSIWPCQGYVCEFGRVKDLGLINVKGESRSPRFIFNRGPEDISGDDFFVNIFLHNHNYHRFHSPVDGVVKKIEVIPGELRLLRPWLYSIDKVSEPALRNERVVVEIEDARKRSWFLSFVGGMGVGQIRISEGVEVGRSLKAGQEMGLFLLGSTCCMIAPFDILGLSYLKSVDIGVPLI